MLIQLYIFQINNVFFLLSIHQGTRKKMYLDFHKNRSTTVFNIDNNNVS